MRKSRKRAGQHPLVGQLKQIRLRRGLTQQRLADMAGVSREWWQDAERGCLNPSIHMLCYVAEAVGMRIALTPRVSSDIQGGSR